MEKFIKIDGLDINIVILYLFCFSYKDGEKYEKELNKKIKNIHISDLENKIYKNFELYKYEELIDFLNYIYIKLNEYGIEDIGNTFSQIFILLFDSKKFLNINFNNLFSDLKNIIIGENDGLNGYINILIGFSGMDNNYLLGNNKLFNLILNEINKYNQKIYNRPDYKANLGLYINNLYQKYKGLSIKEYNQKLKENFKDNDKYKLFGKYKWYGKFLD